MRRCKPSWQTPQFDSLFPFQHCEAGMLRAALILSAFVVLCSPICTQAETLGRIVGRVTVEQTGDPVIGARVNANIGMSEDWPGRRYASTEARTNEKGEYELK